MKSTLQMSFCASLASALSTLFKGNDSGKLAYLAYTGKIELFVRDELAFVMNGDAKSPQHAVRREFRSKHNPDNRNQIDLAKIESNGLVHVLQSKAIYAGDLIYRGEWGRRSHGVDAVIALRKDVTGKARAAVESSLNRGTLKDIGEKVGLLLVTDIEGLPANDEHEVLAYTPVVSRQQAENLWQYAYRLPTIKAALLQQTDQPDGVFPFHIAAEGSWLGQAFEQEVHVHWFLLTLPLQA